MWLKRGSYFKDVSLLSSREIKSPGGQHMPVTYKFSNETSGRSSEFRKRGPS